MSFLTECICDEQTCIKEIIYELPSNNRTRLCVYEEDGIHFDSVETLNIKDF